MPDLEEVRKLDYEQDYKFPIFRRARLLINLWNDRLVQM